MAASVIRPLESAPRRNAPLADVARMAAALARPKTSSAFPSSAASSNSKSPCNAASAANADRSS